MIPNLWLLGFTVVTCAAMLAWLCLVEPKIDARQHPGDELADEIEAWLSETKR